jgi:hypothetical protein
VKRRAAIATTTAIDPQEVFGAATRSLHQPSEIKSEHRTSGCWRQALAGGKRQKIRAQG